MLISVMLIKNMYQGLLFKIVNKIRELSGNFILHELAGNPVFLIGIHPFLIKNLIIF